MRAHDRSKQKRLATEGFSSGPGMKRAGWSVPKKSARSKREAINTVGNGDAEIAISFREDLK
jgi:hypothetical protein